MYEPQRQWWWQHLKDRRLLQRLSGVAVDGASMSSVHRKEITYSGRGGVDSIDEHGAPSKTENGSSGRH